MTATVEETKEQRARRLHAFLTFYGPGGFATPDDVAALELAQQGYAAWREVPWTDLSRGMGNSQEQLATDEGHLRVFWRKWNAMMEILGPKQKRLGTVNSTILIFRIVRAVEPLRRASKHRCAGKAMRRH